MSEAKKPDWERIEEDYRAGVLSLREIAADHGLTHGAINKRAKRDGWERDLSAKIKAKADALVSKLAVSTSVSTDTKISDREIIEANAERIAQVRGEHRADISRMRKLVLDLLAELESVTGNLEVFTNLGEIIAGEDESGKRAEAFSKAISMASRIDGLKKLAEAMKSLVALEREAYGIASEASVPAGSAVFERIERVVIRPANTNA